MRIYTDRTVDTEFKDLGDLGFTGALNDRQFAFLRDAGYTNSLADMMYQHRGGAPDVTAPIVTDVVYTSPDLSFEVDENCTLYGLHNASATPIWPTRCARATTTLIRCITRCSGSF